MAKKSRRQLEEERRRTARQRQFTYAGLGVAGLVIFALIVSYLVGALSPQTTANVDQVAAASSTCDPVRTLGDEGRAHLTGNETPTYRANPPSSGTHNSIPVPAGTYDTPIDVTMEVHSLEHGYVIIHYNGISATEIQQLKNVVARDPRKMILSPYPKLPSRITLTAWDNLQTCQGVNEQAIESFKGTYRDHGPENAP